VPLGVETVEGFKPRGEQGTSRAWHPGERTEGKYGSGPDSKPGERSAQGATAHVCGHCTNSGTWTPFDGLRVEQKGMGVDFARIGYGKAAGLDC
jgi:hypothetical protein